MGYWVHLLGMGMLVGFGMMLVGVTRVDNKTSDLVGAPGRRVPPPQGHGLGGHGVGGLGLGHGLGQGVVRAGSGKQLEEEARDLAAGRVNSEPTACGGGGGAAWASAWVGRQQEGEVRGAAAAHDTHATHRTRHTDVGGQDVSQPLTAPVRIPHLSRLSPRCTWPRTTCLTWGP